MMPRDVILQAQIEGMRDAGEMWHDTPPMMPSEDAINNVSDRAGEFLYRDIYKEQRDSISQIVSDLIESFAPSTFQKDKFKMDNNTLDEILEGFLFDFSDTNDTIGEEAEKTEIVEEEINDEEESSTGVETNL